MATDLVTLITDTLRGMRQELDVELPATLDADTRLFGMGGLLDSLGLVSLIVAVEQTIQEQLGAGISLADEKAMSQRSSPFKTIGSLARYAESLLQARV
jgi:acyl carrier protein